MLFLQPLRLPSVLGTHFDKASLRITLLLEESTLDKAFTHAAFGFEHKDEPHIIHRHDRLSRRGLLDKIGDAFNDAKDGAESIVEDLKETIEPVSNDIQDTIESALNDAKNFFDGLGDDVKGALEAAGQVIDDNFKQTDSENTASLDFSKINSTFELPIEDVLPFDFGCTNCTGKGNVIL
jgi:hypothetical protein